MSYGDRAYTALYKRTRLWSVGKYRKTENSDLLGEGTAFQLAVGREGMFPGSRERSGASGLGAWESGVHPGIWRVNCRRLGVDPRNWWEEEREDGSGKWVTVCVCFVESKFTQHKSNNFMGFPGGLPVVKNLPAMQKMWVQSLGQEDPLEKGMATHSSILTCRIPWTEEPGELRVHGVAWT